MWIVVSATVPVFCAQGRALSLFSEMQMLSQGLAAPIWKTPTRTFGDLVEAPLDSGTAMRLPSCRHACLGWAGGSISGADAVE